MELRLKDISKVEIKTDFTSGDQIGGRIIKTVHYLEITLKNGKKIGFELVNCNLPISKF